MTLEERAACIADVSLGEARGAERRRRIYDKALKMLREAVGEPATAVHWPLKKTTT